MDENFACNDELLKKKNGSAIYLSLPNPRSPFPPLPPPPSFRQLRWRPMVRIEKFAFMNRNACG